MNKQLQAKLKNLPASPGVYFHKSADGEIIYIGKAASLKNRVRSYFNREHDDAKTRALVAEITDTDWIETESELDALFLESEMIKRYLPRYNILLRDDKSQIFVRINLRDEIPFVSFTRQPADDGADYFGPFYSGTAVKNALRILRKIFPYFSKKSEINSALLQQLGLTPSVKNPNSSSSDPGPGSSRKKCHPEFISGSSTSQENNRTGKTLKQVQGDNIKSENDNLDLQLYKKDLRKLISYIKGYRVTVMNEIEKEMTTAARAQNFELAAKLRNQLFNLNELRRQIVFGRDEFLDISKDQALTGLKNLLNLPEIPRRIEAYDVSHISGQHNVASMVVATNGLADKRWYRKFKLRAPGNDDYVHMRETIERRLKHLGDWGRPDLVIIDGGVGQLSAVADLLKVEKIPFIGRNKSGDHGRNARVQIVVPKLSPASSSGLTRGSIENQVDSRVTHENDKIQNYQEILLPTDDHIAKLIARLDDESHRFAVSYHQSLRAKSQTKNALEEIPGIGPKTRAKLLKKFGSLAAVKNASGSELAAVVGPGKAKLINN